MSDSKTTISLAPGVMDRLNRRHLMEHMTDDLLAMLEHSLGLDGGGEPYRKYYVAPVPSAAFNDCERLVELGCMVVFGGIDTVGQTYHVTQLGAELVGAKLP